MSRLRQLMDRARAHAGLRRYAGNTAWVLAEQVVRMGAGVLVGIWVARYLGPAHFGLLSYAVAFAALFASVAKLGLDTLVVRDLVRDAGQTDHGLQQYLGTVFVLKLIGAVALLSVTGTALYFLSDDSTTSLYVLLIAGGAIFQAMEVVDFYFQAKVLSRLVSICKLIQLLVSSIIKVGLIVFGADLFWFVLVTLLDQATLALALYQAYRHKGPPSFIGFFDRTVAVRLLKESWPLMLTGLVVMVYMRLDQIMIRSMLGESEVGLYSAAVRLSEVWYFIPMLINASLFSSIVRARDISADLYSSRLHRLCALLVWIQLPVAAAMTFFSDRAVLLLYGPAYAGAGMVLMIHVWTGVFVALSISGGNWLVCENLQRNLLYRTSIGALVNVALNFVLIPRMGIAGAAVATLVAQAIVGLFFDIFTKRTRPLFLMKIKGMLLMGM